MTETAAPDAAPPDQTPVFAFLGDPSTHAGAPVERIDTHGAVLFLAGDTVYKVKRAVRFPYMDFSTLAARAAACRREIAVNKPNAPAIYRDVVTVTRAPDGRLALGGAGEAVETVVRMARFPADATLDRIVAAGRADVPLIEKVARALADAHRRAPVRDAGPWRDDLWRYLADDRAAFLARPDLLPPERVRALDRASRAALSRIEDLIDARGRLGLCRLLHGDLHLANVAVVDGAPLLFDAVEFDDAVATGDLYYDLAFLIMDLDVHGERALATWLVNLYVAAFAAGERRETGRGALEVFSGDLTAGMAALPFFLSLRAQIRAKVAAARAAAVEGAARTAAETEVRAYFSRAEAYLEPAPPALIAVGGLSGTGKSRLAERLAPMVGAVPGAHVYRSDVLRKVLHGRSALERLPESAYSPEVTRQVYDQIRHLAAVAVAAGRTVIADAVFARPEERAEIEAIARRAEVPFVGLWLEASEEVRAARVGTRTADASDADAAVVHRQEGYDLGRVGWHVIDASGSPEETLTAALEALAAAEIPVV